MEFIDWVMFLEDYFDWFEIAEAQKVRFVKVKLKEIALLWCSVRILVRSI